MWYCILEKKKELKDVRTDSFYHLLVLVYENGPKIDNIEEIEHVEQLLDVWNARKHIEIRFRDTSLKTDICNKGKLGFFVKDIANCLFKRVSSGRLETDLGAVEVKKFSFITFASVF